MAIEDLIGIGGGILGGLSSVLGGGEKTYVPRSSTKNSIRNQLNTLTSLLYGTGATRPGSGVVTGDQYGADPNSMWSMYTNRDQYPYMPVGQYPFASLSPYERQTPQEFWRLGKSTLPGLYNQYANLFGGAFDSAAGGLGQALSGNVDLLNQNLQGGPSFVNPTAQAQGAINSMLSGNLDLNLFQGAIDQYLQPAMEQFNEQLLPAFQRADNASTGGQGSAGALKAAQRTQEQIGEGLGAYLGGRLYDASQAAANRMGQGVAYQQGYDLANQGAMANYTNDLIRAGGLAGQLGQAGDNMYMRGLDMFPQLMASAQMPVDMMMKAGVADRANRDPFAAHDYQTQRYNSLLPYDLMSQFYNIVSGNPATAGYGMAPTSGGGSTLLSGLSSILGQDWGSVFGGGGSGYDAGGMVPIGVDIFGNRAQNNQWMYG